MWWRPAVPKGTWVVREVQRDTGWWLVVSKGIPVVPRGMWGGCSCPGDVVVARSDRGTQGWLRAVVSSGQQCSEGKGMAGGAHGCLQTTWCNWHHPGGPEGGWDAAGGPGKPSSSTPLCPQEELQAWLQGLSAAITECRGSRGKVQSLPLPIPPAPPEASLPRKDKEKRFSFFPKKK